MKLKVIRLNLSAMSWSCSGGTGTPFTDRSLWICWNVCRCPSKFFKTSCTESTDVVFSSTVIRTIPLRKKTKFLAPTLCCSSFLWMMLAVSSWACWMGISSLRESSARCSQAPITPRGPGRDLSRWMCQSKSCASHTKASQISKGEICFESRSLSVRTVQAVKCLARLQGPLCGLLCSIKQNRLCALPSFLSNEPCIHGLRSNSHFITANDS